MVLEIDPRGTGALLERQGLTPPLCPVFGSCGGCTHQDKPYEEELRLKTEALCALFAKELGIHQENIEAVVASPEPYHYRNKLDLTLRRFRKEGLVLGFQHAGRRRLIPVNSCVIARKEISDFIPQLREEAFEKLPDNYRTANLVIKTGDDGRVLWGGIGRRSLQKTAEDYFWTDIHGKRIFYSLDTFFQANLSILPLLMNHIESLAGFDAQSVFFDLYAGVGLFGIYFASQTYQTIMVEESAASKLVAEFNQRYHALDQAQYLCEKVEEALPVLLPKYLSQRKIAIVDPPRRGLSPSALSSLAEARSMEKLFYLSCHPASLARDLKVFFQKGWRIKKVIPFDFFPKTEHLETLVLLEPCHG